MSGKHEIRKKRAILYIILFLGICLIPFLLMPAFGNQAAESEDTQTELPRFFTDGSFNTEYFDELGDYVSANFAFRQQLVSAQGIVEKVVFATSSQDTVVVGKDGYLFYEETIDDYTGVGAGSRELNNITANLALMQKTLEAQGIDFIFTVAPNKNSLYGEYMPDRYTADAESRTITALTPMLKEAGISYVDLFAVFEAEDEVLYHRTDSHWNNRGAALAAEALLEAAGIESTDYDQIDYETRNDFEGDLYEMICPSLSDHETEYYFEKDFTYTYDSEIDSTYDPLIQTTNETKEGEILVYRDSFGNALLPFLADEVGSACFSRSSPADPQNYLTENTEAVIWEIAERNLLSIQEEVPVLAAVAEEEGLGDVQNGHPAEDLIIEEESGLWYISGELDTEVCAAETTVYIQLTNAETGEQICYQAYQTAGGQADGYGCGIYIDPAELENGTYQVCVIAETEGQRIGGDVLAEFENTEGDSQEEEETEKEETDAEEDPGAALTSMEKYAIASEYVDRPMDDLIEEIGEPESETVADSCMSEGDDGQYVYDGFTVYTYAEEHGGEMIITAVIER